MNRLQAQGARFEDLVAKVLSAAGYELEREVRTDVGGPMFAFDMVLRAASGGDRIAEVKWTRLSPVPLRMLRDWAARLASYARAASGGQPVLIVSGIADNAHREWVEEQFDVDVWDIDRLLLLARDDVDLTGEVLAFQAETRRLEAEMQTVRAPAGPEPLQPESPELSGPEAPNSLDGRGEALIKRLSAIPTGNAGAKAYEQTGIEIIDYLFGEHLVDARPQSRTEDGLNIFDVIYRVRPKHSFWNTLTRDFRARVIMFEFKNYTDQVGPQQVYTTERYMSSAALRPICFLVSRKAPHAHAEVAAFGSLRESGKLLVFLSDADLNTMLKFRDAELVAAEEDRATDEDPSVVLDQKIYQFLATMGR